MQRCQQLFQPGLCCGVRGKAGEVKRRVFGKADAVVLLKDDAAQGEAEREAEEVERDHLRLHVFRRDFGDE